MEGRMTQSEQILDALRRGDRLTPADALERYGCFRLAARIYELRKSGHDIRERMVQVPGRDGTCTVAEYSISEPGELFPAKFDW